MCFLGLGKMVEACEQAAEELSRRGVEATVWDVRAAAPLDPLMLGDALRHHVVVTVEDESAFDDAGGVGGAGLNVAEAEVAGECFARSRTGQVDFTDTCASNKLSEGDQRT